MEDCIFCKIAHKEVESYIIEESDNFLVFLDIHPHSPGHSLLIPKNHYEKFEEVPENLGEEFLKIARRSVLLISKALNTKDFNLGINNGPFAGQAVKHAHFHIIPRFPNDKGGSMHSIVYNPPKEDLSTIYKRIIKVKNESQS